MTEDLSLQPVKFVHQKPVIRNYQLFSCEVIEINGNFYFNDLHNRMLVIERSDKFDITRPLSSKEYVLEGLKIISKKVVAQNNSLCFQMFCLDKITFYLKESLKMCHRGAKLEFCDTFVLMFNQGLISNGCLSETTMQHLGWGASIGDNGARSEHSEKQRRIHRKRDGIRSVMGA